LQKFASPIAKARLNRIKPVVEKIDSRFGLGLRRIRLRGNACAANRCLTGRDRAD
jgi:hypothetical protein